MKRKIKIIRIITRLNIGGPSIHVSLLTKGLNSHQFESLLITGLVSPYEGDMSYFCDAVDVKPIMVSSLRREISLLEDTKCLFQLLKILKQEQPDIVHTHTAKAGALGRIAVFIHNLIRRKKILSVHTFHGHTFSGYFSRATSLLFIWTERVLAEITDKVIAISKSQTDELIDTYHIAPANKIETVKLGFDLDPFTTNEPLRGGFRKSLGIDAQTILIGIIGRLVAIKNHRMFFNAARIFLHQNPQIPAKFLVIGDGELRDELIEYCQRHGLSNEVLFCGWKRDLPHIYADLDILALTSVNEGTPVSIIEAMASSVPVISTDAGGVRDLLGPLRTNIVTNGFKVCQRGLLCSQDNAKGFATGLSFLLTNSIIREEISNEARVFARQAYRKERLFNEMESLYLGLLRGMQPKKRLEWIFADSYSIAKHRIRVLQVYKDYYPPVIGGVEGHINLLANGLKERGIDVEVLVSNTQARLVRKDINGIIVTKVPQLGRLASAPLNPTFPIYLRRMARDFDVLHFHYPNPTGEISSIFAQLRNNIVVTYHSDIVRQARLEKLISPFLHEFLEKSNAIVAGSHNYVRSSRVLSQFKNKCKVIPYGIDLEKFVLNPTTTREVVNLRKIYGPSILLFIGRFRYYKGLHVLIEAMDRVEGKLLLIGAGPLEKSLHRQVVMRNLEDKVHFLGELADQKVVSHLHACDVFVLPSVLRSEAFGIVQLEAMACGKPVVCTELSTGTSFVNQHGKTGLVVPPNNVDALARAINHLLENPGISEEYGREGRKRVEKCFSKERMVEDIIDVYQSILS